MRVTSRGSSRSCGGRGFRVAVGRGTEEEHVGPAIAQLDDSLRELAGGEPARVGARTAGPDGREDAGLLCEGGVAHGEHLVETVQGPECTRLATAS